MAEETRTLVKIADIRSVESYGVIAVKCEQKTSLLLTGVIVS